MIRSKSMQAGLLAMLMPGFVIAATPRLDDYARGIAIEVGSQRPLVQLDVPDVVYRTIATDDLSDLRVFNADGVPVPHALCTRPELEQPTITQESLPVYPLQDVPRGSSDGTRVEVQTPSGAQISVDGGNANNAADRQTSAYVIDARGVTDEVRAMQFEWSSSDSASEVRVSIQASDDLDRWRTLVARTTLLQAQSTDGQLRRHRVAIPQARYEYLRVQRIDRGPPLQLDGVIAERVTPAVAIEPTWFGANVTGSDESAYEFDAARRAPIAYARLVPTAENTSIQIAIETRADSKENWRARWSGEVYSIQTETERRVSPAAEFAPTTDRFWRVRLTEEGDLFHQPPTLELAYRPTRLRFVAQGEGPYTLAFGSRRAEAAPARDCDGLLTNLSAAELDANIEVGYPGTEETLGGEDAFRPLPKQTPIRQIVLWGVLVLGVGALVAMALSLLRRIKPDGTT